MRRRRRREESDSLNLSFLDAICCGFGAIILLLVITLLFEPATIQETRADVQGLIDHAPRPVAEKPAKVEKSEAKAEVKAAAPVATPAKATPAPAPAVAAATSHQAEESHDEEWSDDAEEDDDFGNRKLSKADKKRLRRQNRAA